MVEIKEIDQVLNELYPNRVNSQAGNIPEIEPNITTGPEPIQPKPTTEPEPTEPSIKPVNITQDLNDMDQDIKQPEPTTEPEPEYIGLTVNARFLKHIVQLQNFCNTETVLNFNHNSLELKNTDPAHVLMIKQKIPVISFEEYKTLFNNNLKIGVDLDKLSFILKNITVNDVFKMVYDNKNDDNKLNIKIGLFDQQISLIDSESLPDPKIPNLDFKGCFVIHTKIFYDFLTQAERITDHIKINMNRDFLTLYAEGDMDQVKIEIPKNDLEYFEVYPDYDISSLFSIDYLKGVFRHLKNLFTTVEIKINQDYPVKITGDGKTLTEVLIAPRIESE